MSPTSELAWRLADYQAHDQTPPPRIVAAPEACEGELMSPPEVAEYINYSIGSLLVLLDSGSARFYEVRANFEADLDFLLTLGKITPYEYNEITCTEEFEL